MVNDNGWVEIIERNIYTINKKTFSKCLCKICGKTFVSATRHILNGATKSCGCMASLKGDDDLVGKILDNGIVVVGFVSNSVWRVKYTCGHYGDVSLTQAKNSSTGLCYHCALAIPKTTTHGHAPRTGESRTYSARLNARRRCNDPTNNRYYAYGAKGIKFDKVWDDSFEEFLKDMGECPEGYTLERRDTLKGYNKENCLWIPANEQPWNKTTTVRVILDDVTYSLRYACKLYNQDYKNMWYRLRIKGEDIIKYFPQGACLILPEEYNAHTE